MTEHIRESALNLVSENSRIDGKVTFDRVSRINGVLAGEVHGTEGSTLILSESAVVEGNIDADTVFVDGYIHGDIRANTKVVVSRTGRVIGIIRAPSVVIEFGAHFEGRCIMEQAGLHEDTPAPTTGRALKPA